MALVSDPPPPSAPAPAPDAGGDFPAYPWWVPFVVGLAIYIALGVLVAGIAAAAGWSALPDRFVLGATLVQDVALVGGAIVIAASYGRRPLHQLGVRLVKPGRGLLWAAIAFIIFFAFLIAWQQVLDVNDKDDLAQQLGAKDSTLNLVAVAVLVCLVAPIAEELFFRGFIYGGLRKPLGWVGAAVVTGVVFGLIHAGGTDAIFLVPLAVLGFLLCWLYRTTGSLIPGMALHAFNNALALGSTLGWDAGQQLAIVIAAPIVVAGIATLVARRVASAPPPPEDPAPPVFSPPVAPQLPAR